MKKSRVLAFALALMMVLSVSYVPVDAAKKVNVKKITVASSLSGSTKTVVVAKGKTVKLKTVVKVTPNKKANKKVTYKSADKKIATVSKTGVIKGVKAGATTITVTSAVNKKKSAKIKVKVTAKPVSKVTLNQKSATVNLGETVQLKAKVSPAKKADKTVVWTSSDTAVATVTKTGLVSAAGVGSAVITAKSIDGSKKKASCKITVANPINLAAVTVLNAQSITFALDKPMALDASQVSVKTKWYASGNYNKTLKINGMTTNDNVNYTLVFDNDSTIGVGSYVQVAIPTLTGTVKSMEVEYTEAVCAFVGEEITAWKVGTFKTESFNFGNGNGYSNYAINQLPAGLSAEVKGDSLRVKGVPSTAGRTDAVLTAVDELGNTLTKTIHFLVYDENTLIGAANQQYALIGANPVSIRSLLEFVGPDEEYTYSVQNDPSNIVTQCTKYNPYNNDKRVELTVSVPLAGVYTVTVRAASKKDPSKYVDVPCVFHVKQGVVIGGAIKDAEGNPMSSGRVNFRNKDRASVYCAYTYANVDSETSVYSAVVEAGTYDIEASYSYYYYDYDDDIDEYVSYNADEYTLSTKYLYAQPLTATRTGYDIQLDNIYKVLLNTNDAHMKNYGLTWKCNHVRVGYTGSGKNYIYLKNGTYTLETDEWTEYGDAVTTGDWFNGQTTTRPISKCKYTTTVTVAGAAVLAPVTKSVTADTPSIFTKPAAKNTTYDVELDRSYWLDDAGSYYAYAFTPTESAEYTLSTNSVYVYDMNGNQIQKNGSGRYNLTEGTKYIIGNGQYNDGYFTLSESE